MNVFALVDFTVDSDQLDLGSVIQAQEPGHHQKDLRPHFLNPFGYTWKNKFSLVLVRYMSSKAGDYFLPYHIDLLSCMAQGHGTDGTLR